MMKQIAFGIVMLIMSGNVFAQAEDYYSPASDSTFNFSLHENDETSVFNNVSDQKTTFHPMLQMGGSAFSFNGSPYFSSHITPALQIDPPGKFSFQVGTSMIYSNHHTMLKPESQSQENSYFEKMATYQLYASGTYQVNKNLNVYGGASLTLLPGPENNSLKNGHFGFDYSIGDNAHIRADFNFGDAMPYYHNYRGDFNNMNRHTSMPGFGYSNPYPFMY